MARRAYPRFCSAIVDDLLGLLREELRGLPGDEREDGLCWLSLDYGTDGVTQSVDYSRRAARLAYLLRYFFAYSREYCMMYRDVLKDMRPRDELSVCSLGCGAEVDRWSLLRALALDSLEGWRADTLVRYRGFDIQDWSREASLLWEGGDDGSARADWVAGALAFADGVEDGSLTPDIICFPKSAMEIRSNDQVWARVCRALGRLDADELSIAISRSQVYPSVPFFDDPAWRQAGEAEVPRADVGQTMRDIVMDLVAAVQKSGFGSVEMRVVDAATHDAADECPCPDDPYSWRRTTMGRVFTESIFPSQRDAITSLHELCPHWRDGEGCTKSDAPAGWFDLSNPDMCRKTDRFPMGIRSFAPQDDGPAEFRACYAILRFTRE